MNSKYLISAILLLSLAGCGRTSMQYGTEDTAGENRLEAETTTRPSVMEQKENDRDLSITQQIRQSVMDDDSLSAKAKNVKIITTDGKVTLRGPVENAAERESIFNKAKAVAGAQNVENQIEAESERGAVIEGD